MNLRNIMLSGISQSSRKERSFMISFFEVSKVVKFTEMESTMSLGKAWGEGELESYWLIGTVSLLQNEKSFGDLYTAL